MARTAGTAIREDLEASNRFLFTSESVGEGHPDKICDQISDHILDAVIAQDPTAHVAVETAVKTGLVLLFGEVTTHARVDYPQVVRDVLKEIGYDRADKGMDYRGANVLVSIGNQPVEIKECVDERWGAGDQGIMFGYATDETPEMMPLTILLAHKLNRRLACCRRDGTLPYLRPDSKTQVTIEYQNGGGAVTPLRIDAVVISQQHDPDISVGRIKADLMEHVVKPVLVPTGLLDKDTKFHIQPSGSFVMGGPQGDAGLTGRKIIVDSYGGWGAHGGGAFSGKDWTKVDRSAAYAARWIAKSIVAAGLARRILIQLSYTIGVPEPVSIHVDTYGTSTLSRKQLLHLIRTNFDLTPHGIMKALGLDKPIYSATACYGHFGREEFPWEKVKPLQGI